MDRKRILIADDEEEVLRMMNFVLNAEGFDVAIAANGKAALKKIHEAADARMPFDLLITDINMPFMNGSELIGALRKEGNQIPVLTITGYGDKELLIELMRQNCTDYIDKPVEVIELTGRVREIFTRTQRRQQELNAQIDSSQRENSSLKRDLDTLRMRFDQLRTQVDTAVVAYRDIIGTDPSQQIAHMVWNSRPLAELGGDYIGVRRHEHGWYFLLADVAGHDMGASYHHILIKTIFDEHGTGDIKPAAFLQQLNRALLDVCNIDRLVSGVFADVNIDARTVEFASAGTLPLTYIPAQTRTPFHIELTGSVMGMFPAPQFGSKTIPYTPGDRVVLYTDGLPGASRINGKTGQRTPLGLNGIDRLIASTANQPLGDMLNAIWQGALEYCAHKPDDDMLLAACQLPEVEHV